MNLFADYRNFVGSQPDKYYKSTLFRSDALMLGLNCLEPGQVQSAHIHEGADKFYYVVEGSGTFQVGEDKQEAWEGAVVWAPAGLPHGVENKGGARLILLVGIAPAPPERPKG